MRILYAEDEKALSHAVAEILRMEQYEVDAVYDGLQAWEQLTKAHYDAVVLDIMMPKMDGIQVLKRMREKEDFTPTLLLTARSALEDRIEGLTAGADDYLPKPFEMGELLARIDSMIRRATRYKVQSVKCGNIALDCETYELKSDRGSLRLSSREAGILELLMKNTGVPFSQDQIGEKLEQKEDMEQAVMLYLSFLKNKLCQIHSNMEIVRIHDSFMLKERGIDE